MQFVRIADRREGLVLDPLDRVDVEFAQVALLVGQCAPSHHGAGAALFERGVVKEAERVDVDDALRHPRRRDRVSGMEANLAALDPLQHADQRVSVDRLMQAVVHRLRDQRVIGHFERSGQVLLATDLRREHGRQQIVGDHPLQIGRHFLGAAPSRDGQRPSRGPAPAGVPEGRVEDGLAQRLLGVVRLEVLKRLLERERLGRPEREQDALLVGRSLQLEVEADAEALAQSQSPGPVDARAERRVDDQLLTARLVEEALEDDVGVGRHHLQGVLRFGQVLDHLLGGDRLHVALVLQVARCRLRVVGHAADIASQFADGG